VEWRSLEYSYSEVAWVGDKRHASFFRGVILDLVALWCMCCTISLLPSCVCCETFSCKTAEPYGFLSSHEAPSMNLGGDPPVSPKKRNLEPSCRQAGEKPWTDDRSYIFSGIQ
jgi:hypothetical protein